MHRDHHSHSHGALHSHGGGHDHQNERRTFFAMLLIGGFMLIEVAGGLISGSLALLADAGHMLTDAAALALAFSAFRISRRPHDRGKSFGYYRFEVIAAFINGLALFALVIWIVIEALKRIASPPEVMAGPMLAVAIVGLLVNLVAFRLIHGADRNNLNIRAALWHVIGDILGSIAAIIAAIVILYTGWTPIDPLLSLLVAGLLIRAGWSITRRTLHILMEGAPDHIDPETLARELSHEIVQICDVHHLHVWLLTAERPLLTMHITIRPEDRADDVLLRVKDFLAKRYNITHSTIQIESDGCADHPPR
ncbi:MULTISPECIES: cation diffusion facilitator family transporter [unclassified Iodidimonas]|jgi:cobalt-zinc-cadmium efflux system protein|uniref:cation diffusion facilitator family transporter n=1 Tax=unclassified Iodidimonas TaxID=2626145 RepID=UPI0024829938|nr:MULTISPECIES: cation diffusion facilitator family transporter [unclassified Iodidimonas]